jgi:DNA-binding transcriptional MerR regulator/methylmalonyl-CoA mutase cobalamin-binding subunit
MYTIKEAAHRAGVTVPLLRAWERRYGVVRPMRTPSGYRLYDDEAIASLRSMRQLIDSGWTASQAALHLEAAGPEGVLNGAGSPEAEPRVDADADFERLSAAFVGAASKLDEASVEAVVDELFASGSFERVVDDRVMPALRALGDAWAAGTVAVGGEHMASHAVLRRLSAAFEAAGRGGDGPPILVGLPPGSRHELGALAFAATIRRRGLPVVYLGADVPVESWTDAVATSSARAAVVAVPTGKDRVAAAAVCQALVGAVTPIVVAIGGPGSAQTDAPEAVLRLPDGVRASAAALEPRLVSAGPPRRRGC